MSGKIESRWRISTDVRNALALFIGAVTLLAAVWGVCESSFSRLSDRFDRHEKRFEQQARWFELIDERFDRQDWELEQIGKRLDRQDARLDRIESTTAKGFRQANDRMDRTDTRIDRLEAKVDRIESLLIEHRLRVPVEGD